MHWSAGVERWNKPYLNCIFSFDIIFILHVLTPHNLVPQTITINHRSHVANTRYTTWWRTRFWLLDTYKLYFSSSRRNMSACQENPVLTFEYMYIMYFHHLISELRNMPAMKTRFFLITNWLLSTTINMEDDFTNTAKQTVMGTCMPEPDHELVKHDQVYDNGPQWSTTDATMDPHWRPFADLNNTPLYSHCWRRPRTTTGAETTTVPPRWWPDTRRLPLRGHRRQRGRTTLPATHDTDDSDAPHIPIPRVLPSQRRPAILEHLIVNTC